MSLGHPYAVCSRCKQRAIVISGLCVPCYQGDPRSKPPTILCSQCGNPLRAKGSHLQPPISYYCQPCNRTLP